MFVSDSDYDRTRILEAASRARAHKRYRKAIALYRRVLAVERGNLELHARLAPLLAATGRRFEARASFEACGREAVAAKKLEQAAAIYREAARCLPRDFQIWEKLSQIERQRARDQQALDALLEGRQQFRRRGHRPEAIALLRRALEIDEWNLDVILDLARLLSRSDQEREAQLLLERLAQRSAGTSLRRVRGAQWRITPTLINTWRWIHAALTARRDEPDLHRIHA
jgi:tetratricopeptide (TPR) repeat protein